ncbi:MAG: oligoendopeptidase F [Oscillospiraceae bacterium]
MHQNDINANWDLTPIYQTVSDWENAYQETETNVKAFPPIMETMTDSAENLYNACKHLTLLSADVEKLYTYAHLRYSENTKNNESRQLMGKAQNLLTEFSGAVAPFDTIILKMDETQFSSYLKDFPALETEYGIMLKNVFRYKPHTLTEAEEKLIASFSKQMATAEDTYETLTTSDMKFENITDEDGNSVELTNTNYSLYMRSQKREVRQLAFKTLYKGFEQFRNTFASLYAGQIEVEKVSAKVRNYDSALQASLFPDYVTPEIYQNIIDNISGHLDVLFRYYRLKKEVLGVDELHIYDIYQPLIKEYDKKFTYDEAVETVLNAVSIFGQEYVDILRQGYTDRWVDVYPKEGKVGGAFSGGCATTAPYILLNFQGLDDDVSTLAHESGHSMHSWFTRKNNPLQYADYRIFVAEVPSTVNELILAYYRLEHTDNRLEKLSILENLLELYKSTIYRQVMFAEFEQLTHSLSESGEILTADLLCDEYYKLNQKYFGGEVVLDEEIAREWMRIPHFYYNFYVYKYAVGLTAASHIVKRIRNHEEGALESYFAFLKLGTTKNPIDSLKVAGVDMTGTDVFDSAVAMFSELIDEFETLWKEK